MTYYRTFNTLPCPNMIQVRGFLRDHGVGLAKAAHRLGGPAASARVFLLCEAVFHTRHLTRAQRSQLVESHRLLTLEHVGDSDRIEAGLFAMIDPGSAFVEECCLLSEKLGDLLRSIAEKDPTHGARCVASDATSKVA